MKHTLLNGAARTVLGLCLAAGALSACNQNGQAQSAPTPAAALPLEMTATTPTAIAPAPTVSALPPAAPVRVGQLSNPDDTYAYAEQADSLNDSFGDAPPDYGFDYGGTRPWVWRGDDQSERVVEPLPNGGDRYYYYEPGAQYPYLVRDPEYTYGYDSGVLVVIYDHHGHALPQDQYRERVDAASRILARAQAIYQASQQQQHQAVIAANWEARQARIAEDNAAWEQAQAQQSEWAAYHAAHAQQEQQQWDQERFRREAEAARFAQQTNQPQVAQRDWQAAQQAHAQAPSGPAAPFGLHMGGPKPQPPAAPAPGPAPQAAGPAAPVAPQGEPAGTRPPGGFSPGQHPAGDHQPGGFTPNDRQPGGRAPTGQPAAPAGPTPGAPAQGGGFEHHDHQGGPQGAAGPGQHPAFAAPQTLGRPATPAAGPAKPEFHAAPPKPAPAAPAFHPTAVTPPRLATPAAPHAPAAGPPKVFERPTPPALHSEVTHPLPSAAQAEAARRLADKPHDSLKKNDKDPQP